MKIYKTKKGIVIESAQKFYMIDEEWDLFINNDQLIEKVKDHVESSQAINNAQAILANEILTPVASQELWACGVTYLRSKEGRQEESKDAGGGDFYARVYEAERPEVFFKATSHRIVGHLGQVRIRKDSSWDVPEPELTLMVTSSGKIIGYTIGNDMSSRSIEGENPLYLPQAKTYDGCASIGPCIYLTEKPIDQNSAIKLEIKRKGERVFYGEVLLSQMKRSPEELVSFVYRECAFPHGCLIMTGTGIVPGNEFTLQIADEIIITIDSIGTLINQVA